MQDDWWGRMGTRRVRNRGHVARVAPEIYYSLERERSPIPPTTVHNFSTEVATVIGSLHENTFRSATILGPHAPRNSFIVVTGGERGGCVSGWSAGLDMALSRLSFV